MDYRQPQYYQANTHTNTNTYTYNDGPPPQPVETFELTPGCMYICFMLPFPFFCIGCCLSQTAKFRFDNNSRVLDIKTYCGFCACCASDRQIPFDDIVNIDTRLMPGYRINRQPAYKVFLLFRGGEVELTGGVVHGEAMEVDQRVRTIMGRCKIGAAYRGNAARMPPMMPIGPIPEYPF